MTDCFGGANTFKAFGKPKCCTGTFCYNGTDSHSLLRWSFVWFFTAIHTYLPPNSCIPSKANIRMNKNSRNSKLRMDLMDMSSDSTRLRREAQYLVTLKILSNLKARKTEIPKEASFFMDAHTTSKILPLITCGDNKAGNQIGNKMADDYLRCNQIDWNLSESTCLDPCRTFWSAFPGWRYPESQIRRKL